MKKNIILLLSLLISSFSYSQVGINTRAPGAVLDIVDSVSTKPLKMSPLSNSVTNKSADINYTKGSPLYIDDKGQVFTVYRPTLSSGVVMPFDNSRIELSTTWTTIYKSPHSASTIDFRFYTNLSLGGVKSASVSGRVSVANNSVIDIYGYNSTVQVVTLSNNLTKDVTLEFPIGAGLEFQLTPSNEIQVRITVPPRATDSFIVIYDSSVTRVK